MDTKKVVVTRDMNGHEMVLEYELKPVWECSRVAMTIDGKPAERVKLPFYVSSFTSVESVVDYLKLDLDAKVEVI